MINNKPISKLFSVSLIALLWVFTVFFSASSYAITLNLATAPLGEEKGFVTPVGVTTDGTDVFVADYGANAIFKITTSNFSVTQVVSIQKPVAVAYYNAKLYVVAQGIGGKVFNASNGTDTGITFATDVAKPADIVISPTGTIYVSDISVNKVKAYNATTGAAVTSFGDPYPINSTSAKYGNGEFYLISGLAYDSATNRLLVADSGNVTPFVQVGSKYNRKTNTWTKSAAHYGTPKGKVQIYDTNTSGWIRQVITHGKRSSYGQLTNVYGITNDNNYLYILDGIDKKIMIIDNVANDSKAPLWTTRSAQDQQELKPNEVAVADAPNANFTSSPARYAVVQLDSVSLGSYANDFILFKDLVKVGSYLVVTDTAGRVFYFTIS